MVVKGWRLLKTEGQMGLRVEDGKGLVSSTAKKGKKITKDYPNFLKSKSKLKESFSLKSIAENSYHVIRKN